MELLGTVVTRPLIDPGKEQRVLFKPLHKVTGSDTLDEIFGRLSEYFAGARHKIEVDFDLGPCGLEGLSRRVLKETCKIPYGRTRTYQGIAEASGRPRRTGRRSRSCSKTPSRSVSPATGSSPTKAGPAATSAARDRKNG